MMSNVCVCHPTPEGHSLKRFADGLKTGKLKGLIAKGTTKIHKCFCIFNFNWEIRLEHPLLLLPSEYTAIYILHSEIISILSLIICT